MEPNISYMKDFTKLSENEENTIKEAQEVLKSIPLIPCTSGHGLKSAAECIKCGKCEQVCPQHISIRSELEKVAEDFSG